MILMGFFLFSFVSAFGKKHLLSSYPGPGPLSGCVSYYFILSLNDNGNNYYNYPEMRK